MTLFCIHKPRVPLLRNSALGYVKLPLQGVNLQKMIMHSYSATPLRHKNHLIIYNFPLTASTRASLAMSCCSPVIMSLRVILSSATSLSPAKATKRTCLALA